MAKKFQELRRKATEAPKTPQGRSQSATGAFEHCVVKDSPDEEACRKPKYTTLTVSYTFAPFDEGEGVFEFEIPMCENHANAMERRLYDTDLGAYNLSSPQ